MKYEKETFHIENDTPTDKIQEGPLPDLERQFANPFTTLSHNDE